MSQVFRRIASGAGLFAAAFVAHASFHTFRVNEIYSNFDGTVQFIELREGSSASGQSQFRGITLSSGAGASQKTFTFPTNLPSSDTALRSVLIATQGFAALGLVTPDYLIPANFLPQPSGSVNFGNVDIVEYLQLPNDPSESVNRNSVPQQASPRNFAGQTASLPGIPASGVAEFYNTTLNHYFLTADPIEGASIDRGGSGPGWLRTGTVFKTGGLNAVCRFFGNPGVGPNSHFYTADAAECAAVKRDPGWKFESNDFAITPAGAGGTCPSALVPVYRAYNKRFAQNDSNHRITTNFTHYQKQISEGWAAEGIVMCAQP